MLIVRAVLLILFQSSSVFAVDFSGPIISVLDGDTLEVMHNQHPERIRLSGIDCPEKGQSRVLWTYMREMSTLYTVISITNKTDS